MRAAKNDWFVKKALEAERGRKSRKLVWKCIRDLPRGRRGMVPTKSATVKNEDGNICRTPEDQQQRWQRHFTKVLNIASEFSLEELEKMKQRPLRRDFDEPPTKEELENVKQRPLRSDFDEPPTEEELENAIEKLKNGKGAGESCIVAEMLKAVCYEEDFMKRLLSSSLYQNYSRNLHRQQWSNSITMAEIRTKRGDLETVTDKVQKRRLEWLGHVARMENAKIPNPSFLDGCPNNVLAVDQGRDGEMKSGRI